MKYLNLTLLIIAVVFNSGCFHLTAGVRTIGLEKEEARFYDNGTGTIIAKIQKARRYTVDRNLIVSPTDISPFYDYPTETYPGRVSRNSNGEYNVGGMVEIQIDDNRKVFTVETVEKVRADKYLIVAGLEKRSGLGYVSQSLIVVTVPLDIVADVIVGTFIAMAYPFIWLSK